MPPREVKEMVGYVCATAIAITALLTDGMIALGIAGAVAGGLVGVEIGKRL